MAEHEWTADFDDKSDREKVIRETETPWPKTKAELNQLISDYISGTHTYESVVEAMGIIAAATLHYVRSELEVSGFQASAADLVTLRRNRMIKSPFSIVDLYKIFYPQYNVFTQLSEFVLDCSDWISKEAKKKLEEYTQAHPDVIKRWNLLAKSDGDGIKILQVLNGLNPFVESDYETTDCESQEEAPAHCCGGHCKADHSSEDNESHEDEAEPVDGWDDIPQAPFPT